MTDQHPVAPDPADPRPPRLPHQVGRQRSFNEPSVVMLQQPSLLGRLLGWLGWLGVGLCLVVIMGLVSSSRDYYDTSGGVSEKYHSLSKKSRNKIAVIDASGVILQGDGFVKKQIDRIREDKNVRAVVLRVDSPGGTITGSDFIYHHLVKLREDRKLPMVVSMGSIAASGGYYIAMAVGDQEQCVYAEPTTTTGSIGVIIPHYDVTGLMEEFKIKDDSVATHPRKQMLSMTKSLSDDDRAILERYIGYAFDRFKTIVKTGRPKFSVDEGSLNELATGEIFTAEQAKELGLIDEIGFIEDAIERAIAIANLDKEDVRVVTFRQPVSLTAALGLSQSPATGLSLTQLLELSAPKAYYLATSLPLLVSTHQ